MARLIYASLTSLDGYVADERDSFDWAEPDADVHAFINEQQREIKTYLYGRRLYEVMVAWEDMDTTDEPAEIVDYAQLWRAADKIVFSRSLTEVGSARTRIEPEFDPAAVARLKQEATTDLVIGGAELAGQALAAGLVDEIQQFLCPVVVGGGRPFLPAGLLLPLELQSAQPFGSGVVFLSYRPAGDGVGVPAFV